MIESLLSVVGQRGVDALAFLLAFALTALMDSVFHDKLPHDHGREFAVNGALSKGKARGSGLIFVLCIALVSMAFLPFKVEYVIYTVLLIASMLSGYFDDAAETYAARGVVLPLGAASLRVTYGGERAEKCGGEPEQLLAAWYASLALRAEEICVKRVAWDQSANIGVER